MLRVACAIFLVLAITVSAAEFVIERSDIVAAEAYGTSVTLWFTPAKAADWAQWPKEGLQLRLVPSVPSKDVYVSGGSASTIIFRFADPAMAATFASSLTQGEKKP